MVLANYSAETGVEVAQVVHRVQVIDHQHDADALLDPYMVGRVRAACVLAVVPFVVASAVPSLGRALAYRPCFVAVVYHQDRPASFDWAWDRERLAAFDAEDQVVEVQAVVVLALARSK